MALVWLMMYFSICLMIIISICSMIIVSREYFEITFISRKKGLCWPSLWNYFLFDIRSAQSANRFYVPRFEMIFWNYYHSLKKGLCWPSVRDYLLFDIRSAQSTERFFMIPVLKWYMTFISKWVKASYLHFEMLYDCHFEMRGTKFSYTKLFSSGEPRIFY